VFININVKAESNRECRHFIEYARVMCRNVVVDVKRNRTAIRMLYRRRLKDCSAEDILQAQYCIIVYQLINVIKTLIVK
jgi:hypothetical protein